MGSILLPPAATGGAVADVLSVFLDPPVDSHFQYGGLVPTEDVTGKVVSHWGLLGEGTTVDNGLSDLVFENDGVYARIQPVGLNGEVAYFEGPKIHHVHTTIGYDCLVKFRFHDADRSRLWLGFFTGVGTTLASGDPGTNHAGIRFQNGDTNWIFASRGNVGQETTNTGVAPVNDTSYYFRCAVRNNTVVFTLLDADFVSIASATHSVAFPSFIAEQRFICFTQNDGVAAQRHLQLYSAHVVNLLAA